MSDKEERKTIVEEKEMDGEVTTKKWKIYDKEEMGVF